MAGVPPSRPAASPAFKTAERAVLAAALVIVALRPLIAESLDAAEPTIVASLKDVTSPLPFASLLFDVALMVLAATWLLLARIARVDVGRLSCKNAVALLAVAWIGSALLAGNHRLAVNSAVESAAAVTTVWLFFQLLRSQRRMHLTLCVVVATGLIQAVECFHQRFYVFPEATQLYEQQREQVWAARGVPLDSETVKLFESRLKSREAAGFLSHSNVAAAHLLMCGLIVASMTVTRDEKSRRRTIQPAPAVLTIILALALWLTRGRAAMAAALIGLGYLAVRHRYLATKTPDDVETKDRPLRFWRYCVIAAGLSGISILSVGLLSGSLPTRSLDFRWKYWTASAAMVADYPVFGVGGGNFGRHFPQYKSLDCPEEVTDPHNFIVTAAAETGIVGVTGFVLLLLTLSSFAVARKPSETADLPRSALQTRPAMIQVALIAATLCTAVFLIRIPLLGVDDPNYRYFATVWPMLAWPIGFLMLAVGVRPTPITMSRAASVALIAFLIQDSVNFALQVPGTLFTAAALLAVTLAGRNAHHQSDQRQAARAPATAACIAAWILCSAAVVLILLPVAQSNLALAQARTLVRQANPNATDRFQDAARFDPYDSQPLFEAARFEASLGQAAHALPNLDEAARLIDQALPRDPHRLSLYRFAAKVHLLRFQWTSQPSAIKRAIALADAAESLYPTSPDQAELSGECLAALAAASMDPDHIATAIAAYERALRLDADRPEWERIRRWTPAHRREISANIARLAAMAGRRNAQPQHDGSHASRPAASNEPRATALDAERP